MMCCVYIRLLSRLGVTVVYITPSNNGSVACKVLRCLFMFKGSLCMTFNQLIKRIIIIIFLVSSESWKKSMFTIFHAHPLSCTRNTVSSNQEKYHKYIQKTLLIIRMKQHSFYFSNQWLSELKLEQIITNWETIFSYLFSQYTGF